MNIDTADRQIRRSAADLAALVVVATALVVGYAAIAATLVQQWRDDETYSHGFIVVPVAMYFAWQRRDVCRNAPRRPSAWGFAIVLVSLAVLVVGTVGAELFLARVSFLGVVAGITLFLFGPTHLNALKIPLLFLLLAIPVPAILLNTVTFPLQLIASQAGEAVIRAAGVPVIREGNVIELASMRLEVVEACSGIRSIMALLSCACFVTCVRPTKPLTAIAVLASTIPVAIGINALRVAVTGLAAQFAGPWAAEGFFHAASGIVLFVAALGALLAVERSLRLLDEPRPVL
jgi:exosortase